LREEAAAGRRYELIVADPPYEAWGELEAALAGALPRVAAPGGIVVLETDANVEPQLPLDLVTTRRYGSARLTIFSS
jgi:16S rRNA G966 N2-methylase RsmD